MSETAEPKKEFLEYCNLSVSLFSSFNRTYKKELRERTAQYRRLFLKNNRVSVPLNREPKPAFQLDTMMKERFEAAFDTNLEKVKIHTGEYATELTRRANAEAVTVGSDIYFSQGLFNLDSEEGLILLAHELQHVVQYNSGKPMRFREDVEQMEAEADRVEVVMKGNHLHGIQAGALSQSGQPETEKRSGNAENQMAAAEPGASGNLDDFSNSNTETVYRLHIGTKIYEVSRKERDLIISRAADKLEEKLAGELSLSSSGRADEVLMKFLKFMGSC